VGSPHAAAQADASGAQSNPLDRYLELRLQDDTDGIRRVRIALLNCEGSGDVFSCDTSKQQALAGLGAFFAGAGTIGMLTTGIMLGVRNRQKRKTEELIRQKRQTARLHWDVDSSRLRF
jgi:hypothetical protein